MWNWKTVYEDDTYAFYCDLSNIIDTVGDEEGCYAGAECYMPLPERCGIWTSLFLKKKAVKKRYVTARKKGGLPLPVMKIITILSASLNLTEKT